MNDATNMGFGLLVMSALVFLLIWIAGVMREPKTGETVNLSPDEAYGRSRNASEQMQPHDNIEARQFYYNDDSREWEHIPGTGEPEPGPMSLVNQRITEGRDVHQPSGPITYSHRVVGRDMAEIRGHFDR